MAHQSRPAAVAMSHPAEWLAVLRIVVGLYFVKSLVTKMSVRAAGWGGPDTGSVGAVAYGNAKDRGEAGIGKPPFLL